MYVLARDVRDNKFTILSQETAIIVVTEDSTVKIHQDGRVETIVKVSNFCVGKVAYFPTSNTAFYETDISKEMARPICRVLDFLFIIFFANVNTRQLRLLQFHRSKENKNKKKKKSFELNW